MENNTQSRKWNITINNPIEKNFSHEQIKEILSTFKSCIYWCMSDEVGSKENTFHTHLYFACSSAVRFTTVKARFDKTHIEMAKGTSQQNMEYTFKEGKWLTDTKGDTNLRETHEEFGDLPVERQGARNDLHDLYDMIKNNMSNYEIIENNPEYMMCIDKIERARQIIKEEKYKCTFRDLEVIYITGSTGTGKTRGVMEEYGYENVFRITDYNHPFDSYKNQDVIIFEEFRSSLKIQEMLNYLDGYPLELPCRYSNKIACYTKVYIITNIELSQQYETTQLEYNSTWKALLRRIKKVKIYETDKTISNYELNDFDDVLPCQNKLIKKDIHSLERCIPKGKQANILL